MNWRLIELETHDAAMNMAVDHTLYETATKDDQQPVIRFYKWKHNTISLGAYQRLEDINVQACKDNDVAIVRRMTGGRAVFHGKDDFTYSVTVPIREYSYSITTAYRAICTSLLVALKRLGIKAQIAHHNDILVDSKKISGNASKVMDKGMILQHGTLLVEPNHELMTKIFDHPIKLFEDTSISINELTKASQEKIYDALKEGFTQEKTVEVSKLTPEELAQAEELAAKRYSEISLPNSISGRTKGACYVERGSD